MRGRSAIDSAGIPAALLKPTPRHVRANASGRAMLIVAAALVVAGGWGGNELQTRADIAERHVMLFASERVLTGGDVVELRRRGDGNNHRIIAHYRYTVHGQELTGRATLRRGEQEKYGVGSPSGISRANRNRAGSMAIRPGLNRAGAARSSRSRAASLP